MFKPENIYAAYRPLYLISKIIGLMSFSIKNHNGIRRQKFSLLSATYCFSMTIFMIYREVFLVKNLLHIKHLKSVLKTTWTIETITCNFTSSMFFILCIFNRRKIFDIFIRIAKFDEMIKLPLNSYKRTFSFVMCQIFFYFLYLGSLGVLTVLDVGFSYSEWLSYIGIINNVTVIVLVDTEIFNFMLLFKQRFNAINTNLIKFSEHRDISKQYYHEASTISGIIRMKYFDEIPVIEVHSLTKLYDQLFDLCEETNSAYSMHILLTVTMKFIAIIFSVYLQLLRILKYHTGCYNGRYVETIMVGTLCWNILQLFILLWSCKIASQEVS
ncbi:hypothetical protein L9F63_011325, partial [Diploptera punctata]